MSGNGIQPGEVGFGDAIESGISQDIVPTATKLLKPEIVQEVHPNAVSDPLKYLTPDKTTASSASTIAARTAAVVAAREAIDLATHLPAKYLKGVKVAGEAAQAAEDIAQVALNPWTFLASPVYIPYRLGSAVVNEITGREEAFKPYDIRPTVGNAVDKILHPIDTIRDIGNTVGNIKDALLTPAERFLEWLF